MDRAEETHQWKITSFAVIGALIAALVGGFFTLLGTYIVLDQQQTAMNQQEIEEQQNIAHALYYDISSVENLFNYSLNHSASKPNSIHVLDFHYYDNNGLYYVFSKDISGFDSETSKDLYDFYGFVLGIESEQEDLLAITQKRLNAGNVSDYEFIHAQGIIKTLCAAMPDGIKRAEKVKKDLRQKYHVNITVPQTIISYYPPQTYILQCGSVEFSA